MNQRLSILLREGGGGRGASGFATKQDRATNIDLMAS